MNKKFTSAAIVCGIILFLWTVIFFAVPFPKYAASVVAYIFSAISIIAAFGITYIAFKDGTELKSKFYGFAIFKIGAIYSAAQILFTLLIAGIGFFARVPLWILAVVSIVFLGLAAIGVIAADNARDVVETQDEKVKAATRTVKYFRIDVASIVDSCKDSELKKRLEKLSDQFKYSDPVSNEKLEEIESRISFEIEALRGIVNTDTQKASQKADEIAQLLSERNRICKIEK